jgi:DNA-binding beta-propeller fold protein YncE
VRPAVRRIAGIFLLVAALLGACNVLGLILLSGCDQVELDKQFDRTIPYGSRQFNFFCNKGATNRYVVYDQQGTVVASGTNSKGCVYALVAVIRQFNSGAVPAISPGAPANRSAASGTATTLAYILDVENYNAVQILNPSTVTFTEVDLPGGAASAYPVGMDMTPDGTTLWVAQLAIQTNGGGVPPQPPQISIMNTATQAFTGSFPLPAGISPNTIVFSPDGTTAYLTNDGAASVGDSGDPANSSVLVINVASKSVAANIATPTGAGPMVMTPDGLLLYTVENTIGIGPNALTVIDTTTQTVATSVPLPNPAIKLFINPSGTRLYVFSYTAIGVFDTATNRQLASIPTSGFSLANNWAVFSPDDQSVWFCNCGVGKFYKVDQRTNQLTQTVQGTGLGVGFMFGLPN